MTDDHDGYSDSKEDATDYDDNHSEDWAYCTCPNCCLGFANDDNKDSVCDYCVCDCGEVVFYDIENDILFPFCGTEGCRNRIMQKSICALEARFSNQRTTILRELSDSDENTGFPIWRRQERKEYITEDEDPICGNCFSGFANAKNKFSVCDDCICDCGKVVGYDVINGVSFPFCNSKGCQRGKLMQEYYKELEDADDTKNVER